MNRGAARRLIAVIFVLSLIAQIVYEIVVFGRERVTFLYAFRIVLVLGSILILIPSGKAQTFRTLLRIWIAVDFAYSIADRFGLVGPYGSAGVSWGNWKNFVAYTHTLNGYLPEAAAPFLAWVATLYESVLVVTLALGIYSRLFLAAASLLTAVYVVTMSWTSGFVSQFEYAVLLICTASLFLATRESPLTLKPGG